MKNGYLLLLISFGLVIITQCTVVQQCPDKESFIKTFDETISNMGDKRHVLTDQEWRDVDDDVKDLLDVCYMKYKEELSLSDKVDVIKNLMIYEVHRDIDDLDLQSFDLKDEVEALGTNGAREIERFVKEELGETLETTIDDVLKKINEIGEGIKEWLKE